MWIYNLAQKFSTIVEKNPKKTAIIFENIKYTYSELDNYSNKILNYFLSLKIKVGDRICISLKKDFFTYSLLIACIKIGAPYVFLDPTSPRKRSKKIIENVKPKLCIHEDQNNKFIIKNKLFVNVENIKKKINRIKIKKENYDFSHIYSNNIAYIMFTSGSTGEPKGVTISHKNLLNFSQWCKNEYKIEKKEIFTNLNALHFDNSVFDIYAGLFNSAAIVPFNSTDLIDPKLLMKKIKLSKATIWFSVPSLIIYLMSFGFFKKNKILKSSLKKIIFGGEGFPKSKLKDLYQNISKKIDIFNVYGPTECTCICSNYKINLKDFNKKEMKRFAPFGKKLSQNFFYFIIDNKNKICPNGKTGELVIGGENVSKGYYNSYKETKEKFIQNPFNKKFNEIVYRTGDLVYIDKKNKNIYFSSRIDNQIKYLGYRIELGEIEQNINQIDGVTENFVSFGKKDKIDQIVCFISHSGKLDLIREKLNKILPKYMMPNRFIEFRKLPKNQNGKIHRTKLQKECFD